MSKRNSKLLIFDIISSIEKIKKYVTGYTFETFFKTQIVIDAVARNFTIIREATSRLPKEFRDTHNHIPWKQIKNFRNLLINEYFVIDLQLTWSIARHDLPALLLELKELDKNLPDTLFENE